MFEDILIPARDVYALDQTEFQINAAEALLDIIVEPMIHCKTCHGLLEEYAKEAGGDLDKAARNWMEENVDALYAAVRAADQLLRDAQDGLSGISRKEVKAQTDGVASN